MVKVLLTGATGYIGGTVLDHLIRSSEPSIKSLTIDVLVRNKDAAEILVKEYGDRVRPIFWTGFTDIPFVTEMARNYDIIINTGTGFIADGAKALVHGLADRSAPALPVPWMLHISGCSNLADRPLTRAAHPDREWDDADGKAVYDFLENEDAHDPYAQRTTEVAVLTAAEEAGVQAVSLNSPCIFGMGTGLFNRQSFVIPLFMRYVVKHGYGFKLNETANFDWVHVEDLAEVYVLLVRAIVEREDHGVGYIPTGKHGIISTAAGRVLQTEMMQLCLDTAFNAGVLPRKDTPREKQINKVELEELANEIMAGMVDMAERSWAGHKIMRATKAKKLLGWNPTRLDEAWKQEYRDVLNALEKGISGNDLETSISR
jgi:nucleoside-diphosphate-sugar epimerase